MLTKTAVRYIVVSLAIMASFATPAVPQSSEGKTQIPSRIVSAIDDSVRFTVEGSMHPLATSTNDIGPLNGATALARIVLVLAGSPDQDHEARTLLDSQQTKGSPDYHHWLTPEEFGEKFGPSAQDIQQVTGWLQQHGFAIGGVAKSGRWIEFSGTVAQVEEAFQTRMRQYLVGGEIHVANANEISIPTALSPVVKGVLSLHNFFSKPMIVPSPLKATATRIPDSPQINRSEGRHGIVPGDFAKIYDLNPLYNAGLNGSNQTIAIVARSNINVSDVTTFRDLFGLSANPPNIILNGPDPGVDFEQNFGKEATIDTEWAGAVAPGATIDVVVSGGSLITDPLALSSEFIVDHNLAGVMSFSFGSCEMPLSPGQDLWTGLWEQAAAQGISVFVATGNSGAAGCDPKAFPSTVARNGVGVNRVASTPFNTAVGGTEFNESASASTFWGPANGVGFVSALGYIPEMVWNESCDPTKATCPSNSFSLSAGGGGVSIVYPTPPWQTLNIPGLSTLTSFALPGSPFHPRGLPDVSLAAAALHDPYVFCFSAPGNPDCQTSGGSTVFQNFAGGTSFASPAFAGIMAIVDQKSNGRQGLANYVLYPLAAAENYSGCNSSDRGNPATPTTCIFNDITVGNNGVPGNDVTNNPTQGALGYPTTTGYDLATGLGSVDATNLVNAWAGVKFQGSQTTLCCLSLDPPGTFQHGEQLLLTVNVQKAGGGPGPTGSVVMLTSQGQAALFGGPFTTLENGSVVSLFDIPGGSYNLFARYSGDGTFAPSESNAFPLIVTPEDTITPLFFLIVSTVTGGTVSGNTVAYGDGQNILAVEANPFPVSKHGPPISSGNVIFTINNNFTTNNNPVVIPIDNSGIAEFRNCISPPRTCLVPGQYTFSASYSGDGVSYNGSTSTQTVTIAITKGNPAVNVKAPAATVSGQQFTLLATIQPPPLGSIVPTGTVQFLDGTMALGDPVTLSGGQASIQVTLNAGSPHSLSAQYSGDNIYNGATSQSSIVNVTPVPFSLSAATASQSISAGGTATYNLTLEGMSGFTGQVNLTCTGAPGGSTCSVTPNPASLSSTITSVPLTVTVSNTANARLMPTLLKTLSFVLAGLMGVLTVGLRPKPRQRILLLVAVLLLVGAESCGGGGGNTVPTNSTLTLTATSGGVSSTITLNLIVTH